MAVHISGNAQPAPRLHPNEPFSFPIQQALATGTWSLVQNTIRLFIFRWRSYE
jgi:hypothetical protein